MMWVLTLVTGTMVLPLTLETQEGYWTSTTGPVTGITCWHWYKGEVGGQIEAGIL